MSMTIAEIESAIEKLPNNEVEILARWFEDFQAQVWEKQIEQDLQNGKLQKLIEEAEKDFAEGNYQSL